MDEFVEADMQISFEGKAWMIKHWWYNTWPDHDVRPLFLSLAVLFFPSSFFLFCALFYACV